MANQAKPKSQKIAERIAQLQAEMQAQQEKEDREADSLLVRLAHRAHMRDEFIRAARQRIAAHERELARERHQVDAREAGGE